MQWSLVFKSLMRSQWLLASGRSRSVAVARGRGWHFGIPIWPSSIYGYGCSLMGPPRNRSTYQTAFHFHLRNTWYCFDRFNQGKSDRNAARIMLWNWAAPIKAFCPGPTEGKRVRLSPKGMYEYIPHTRECTQMVKDNALHNKRV